jgi:NAD(P)H-dependent flavin oxidoreductase YrpB (nitropropane dioxygenase family)
LTGCRTTTRAAWRCGNVVPIRADTASDNLFCALYRYGSHHGYREPLFQHGETGTFANSWRARSSCRRKGRSATIRSPAVRETKAAAASDERWPRSRHSWCCALLFSMNGAPNGMRHGRTANDFGRNSSIDFDEVSVTLVWAGQTAGGVREILPVAEIMRRLVDETEAALARAPALH